MKRQIIMTTAVFLLSGAAYAQSSSRLSKVTNGQQSYSFEYNKAGQLAKTAFQFTYSDETPETFTDVYTYASDKIEQVHSEGNSSLDDVRTAVLADGRISEETIVMGLDKNAGREDVCHFHCTYNDFNELVKVETDRANGTEREIYELTWTDGGPSHIRMYKEGVQVGEIYITYNTSIANPYVVMLGNPLSHIFGYENIVPYGQFLGNYYGAPVKYAPETVEYRVVEPNLFHWAAADNYRMFYVKNENGEVERFTQMSAEQTTFNAEWVKVTTGIASHNYDGTSSATYYNMNGVPQTAPRKGLNIVRMSDGSVRKVLK